jgi:tetratricopeptide (TPR) repeat protein
MDVWTTIRWTFTRSAHIMGDVNEARGFARPTRPTLGTEGCSGVVIMRAKFRRGPSVAALVSIVVMYGGALSGAQAPSEAEARVVIVPPGGTSIPAGAGELTPQVQAHLRRGGEFTGREKYALAVRAYRRAVEIARAQGHLPSLSSWRWANAHYYEGDLASAARVLDALAGEAAQHGDLVVQARALYNAAWVHARLGRRAEAETRLARLARLLASPYMPASEQRPLSLMSGRGPRP